MHQYYTYNFKDFEIFYIAFRSTFVRKYIQIRQSSCVKARDILHLLSHPEGYPIWLEGTPSLARGTLSWNTPCPDLAGGTSSLTGGVPHTGVPPLWPGWVVPHPWSGGTPSLGNPVEKTWDQWKYYGMEIGNPPVWTDRHLWKQYLPVVLRTRAVKMFLENFIHNNFAKKLGPLLSD